MSDQPQYALRFISGKYQGGEFPLKMGSEILIGRSSELDMVLVEDMVSRKHAKISTANDQIVIQDLGSTNGTFVNGEKITRVRLREGDRILIGTSIVKLITVEDGAHDGMPTPMSDFPPPVPGKGHEPEVKRQGGTRSMAGTIDEIPLPDLLQLLSTSRKSGVLEIQASEAECGRIYLRDGQIYYAAINDNAAMPPRKSIYRMLIWQSGTFELQPPDSKEHGEELTEPTEALLMEAMRQLDEIKRLQEELPDRSAALELARPLPKPLRELSPDQLDLVQLVLEHERLDAVVDHCSQPDLETYTTLAELLRSRVVNATST